MGDANRISLDHSIWKESGQHTPAPHWRLDMRNQIFLQHVEQPRRCQQGFNGSRPLDKKEGGHHTPAPHTRHNMHVQFFLQCVEQHGRCLQDFNGSRPLVKKSHIPALHLTHKIHIQCFLPTCGATWLMPT